MKTNICNTNRKMLLKNTLIYVMGIMDTQGDIITELHTTLNDRSTSNALMTRESGALLEFRTAKVLEQCVANGNEHSRKQ